MSIRGKEGIFSLGIITGLVATALVAPGALVFSPNAGFVVALLGIALATTVVRFTRAFGLGFFATLLVGSMFSWGVFSEIWWKPVSRYSAQRSATRTARELPEKSKQAFLDKWRRGGPLDTLRALSYAREMQMHCLGPALPGSPEQGIPTSMQLTKHPACEQFRSDAYDIPATYPDRFGAHDDAWRWTLSASDQPSYLGGPGFLLTIRPESLIARPGPLIQVDGRDVLTIRDSANGPSRIVETPIPAMQRLRQCIMLVGDSLQNDVRGWRYVMMNGTRIRRKCGDIRVEHSSRARWEGGEPVDVRHEPVPLPKGLRPPKFEISYKFLAPRMFELHSSTYRRRFLLSADGTLHVTVENRLATTMDGPPLACEVDPSGSCY